MAFELVRPPIGRHVAVRDQWANDERFIPAHGRCAVNFGFVASLILVILAVVGVFIEIPIISNYAFWFAIGAYILLAGTRA